MSRPLFAITVISAFWLSFLTTSLVSGNYGGGHEDLGKAAIANISVRQQLNILWKQYGCHEEINKDLLLAPMWCKGKQSTWGDPLGEGNREGSYVASVPRWGSLPSSWP